MKNYNTFIKTTNNKTVNSYSNYLYLQILFLRLFCPEYEESNAIS